MGPLGSVCLALLLILPVHGLVISTEPLFTDAKLYSHVAASFGPADYDVTGAIVPAVPEQLCYVASGGAAGAVLLVERGNCTFAAKVLLAQELGAVGVIVGNTADSDQKWIHMGAPSGFDNSLVTIPAVFVPRPTYERLRQLAGNASAPAYARLNHQGAVVYYDDPDLGAGVRIVGYLLLVIPGAWLVAATVFGVRRCLRQRRNAVARTDRARLMPLVEYRSAGEQQEDALEAHEGPEVPLRPVPSAESEQPRVLNDTCAICLEAFTEGLRIKALPCHHGFHVACIDPWLNDRSDLCPVCKKSILDGPLPNQPKCCSGLRSIVICC